MSSSYKIVAKVVRMEHDPDKDELFLVFEICDEEFKAKIKENWNDDIELMVIPKVIPKEK